MNASTFEEDIANFNRGVCILLHVTPGDPSAISCGQPATHLVKHQAWGRGMECCQELARKLSDARKGYQMYAWDSLTSPAPIPAWVAEYIAKGGQA